MKLYGNPDSAHSFKVKFCLDSASIEHTYQMIDIFADRSTRPAEFIKRSTFCEVPLLIDGDRNLIQSNAILIYLANKVEKLGAESDTTMQSCIEWLVWEANKIGMCIPQIRGHHKWPAFQLNDGALAWLTARYDHDVNVLETQLQDDRPFILGDQLTIADISLSAYLFFADEAKLPVPIRVQQWLERLNATEGWSDPYTSLA